MNHSHLLFRKLQVFAISIALSTLGPAAMADRNLSVRRGGDYPRPYLKDSESFILSGRAYAYFNHNSATWDKDETTLGPTLRLHEMVERQGISVISNVEAFEEDDPVDDHFLDADQIDYPVQSSDGSHRLRFPSLRAMIVSGGYLEHCLSRTIHDIVDGTKGYRPSGWVQLFLVTDAIYVSKAQVQSNLNRKAFDASGNPSAYSLLRALAFMSDKDAAEYVRTVLIDGDAERHHNDNERNIFGFENIRVRIFRGARQIGTVGDGSFTVDLVLTDTRMISAALGEISRR